MLDCSVLILGTCHGSRLAWLKENLNHLDKQEISWKRKVLAIDEFNGWTFPKDMYDDYIKRNWVVIIDNHRSRIKSMQNAFSIIDSEYMFYNEEDVLSIVPSFSDLEKVFSYIDGRKVGMVSLTLGGSRFDPAIKDLGDLRHMEENKIFSSEEYIIFKRMESLRNDYFFEFPGLFIRTELFKKTTEDAKNYFSNQQIEVGLTSSWFLNNFDKSYYKCSLARRGSLSILLENQMKVNTHCRLLTNLDPAQGSSPFGGNHHCN